MSAYTESIKFIYDEEIMATTGLFDIDKIIKSDQTIIATRQLLEGLRAEAAQITPSTSLISNIDRLLERLQKVVSTEADRNYIDPYIGGHIKKGAREKLGLLTPFASTLNDANTAFLENHSQISSPEERILLNNVAHVCDQILTNGVLEKTVKAETLGKPVRQIVMGKIQEAKAKAESLVTAYDHAHPAAAPTDQQKSPTSTPTKSTSPVTDTSGERTPSPASSEHQEVYTPPSPMPAVNVLSKELLEKKAEAMNSLLQQIDLIEADVQTKKQSIAEQNLTVIEERRKLAEKYHHRIEKMKKMSEKERELQLPLEQPVSPRSAERALEQHQQEMATKIPKWKEKNVATNKQYEAATEKHEQIQAERSELAAWLENLALRHGITPAKGGESNLEKLKGELTTLRESTLQAAQSAPSINLSFSQKMEKIQNEINALRSKTDSSATGLEIKLQETMLLQTITDELHRIKQGIAKTQRNMQDYTLGATQRLIDKIATELTQEFNKSETALNALAEHLEVALDKNPDLLWLGEHLTNIKTELNDQTIDSCYKACRDGRYAIAIEQEIPTIKNDLDKFSKEIASADQKFNAIKTQLIASHRTNKTDNRDTLYQQYKTALLERRNLKKQFMQFSKRLDKDMQITSKSNLAPSEVQDFTNRLGQIRQNLSTLAKQDSILRHQTKPIDKSLSACAYLDDYLVERKKTYKTKDKLFGSDEEKRNDMVHKVKKAILDYSQDKSPANTDALKTLLTSGLTEYRPRYFGDYSKSLQYHMARVAQDHGFHDILEIFKKQQPNNARRYMEVVKDQSRPIPGIKRL